MCILTTAITTLAATCILVPEVLSPESSTLKMHNIDETPWSRYGILGRYGRNEGNPIEKH